MTIHRIQPNPRLSGAVTFGDLVFLSGQVPNDATEVGGQTRQVLEKIDALLAEAGSDKDQRDHLPEGHRQRFRGDE